MIRMLNRHTNNRIGIAAAVSAFFALAAISCSPSDGGKGTLIVTTTPIPGEIVVNSVPRGMGNIALDLPAGAHEVAYVVFAGQFIVPEAMTVRVTAGDTVRVAGVFRSALIPDEPPPGFVPADSVRFYGTNAQRLKDGTIYDYLSDGGMPFVKHDVRTTTHALFRGGDGSELVLDIFETGVQGKARNAFGDTLICPDGYVTLDIGQGCKLYEGTQESKLCFLKSGYLVILSVTDSRHKDAVVDYARIVAELIH
jgi:hypothetical protein